MVVRIRLSRWGVKKKPFYRIVAQDGTKPRDGAFLEVLGTYDPKTKENVMNLKKDRYDYWLQNGAQPSNVIYHLVKKLEKQPANKAKS